MIGHLCAGLAVALFLVAIGNSFATAQESKGRLGEMWQDRLETLTKQLNLNKQQQGAIHEIFTQFDDKTGQLDRQLWTLHQQECAALEKVLNPDQRAKLPGVLKQEREKIFNAIALSLGLTGDEKQRIRNICEKYEPKFESLAHERGDDAFKKLRDLRHEVAQEIQKQLNADQRGKFPGILREEFHQWHDPAMRSKHLEAIGDQLNLDDAQRDRAHKVIADFDQQMKQPAAQLHQLYTEEKAAIEKQLNNEQRTKLQQLLKGAGR